LVTGAVTAALLLATAVTGATAGTGVAGSAARSVPSAAVGQAVPAPVAADVPTTFTHPGVHVSRPQLDFVRQQVQAGAQPWRRAYAAMMARRYASLSYTPHPRAVVECGSYSNPNDGCTDEREDAIAAYT